MQIELIGLLTLAVGAGCLILGPVFASYAVLSFSLLGAAAAAKIGGANLQPGHLLLGFLALDLVLRAKLLNSAIKSAAPFRPGFWLLVTVCYAIPASFILPRLFAGATYVFALGESDAGAATILQVPLGPGAANLTQSVYLIGGFLTYLIFSSYAVRPKGLETLSSAVIFCAILNVIFALVDLVTYYTGTAWLLSFVRNAGYRIMADLEVAGFKRIVGIFPEASTFAYFTVGLFGYTLSLWLRGIATKSTGIAALGCFCALAFSTSSSGYLAMILLLSLQYCVSLVMFMRGRAHVNAALSLVYAPMILFMLVLLLTLHSPAREAIENLVEQSLLEKVESQSGVERLAWNTQALEALWSTSGLGAGLGSVRASSWLIAVPASIGIFGAFFYWLFVGSVLVTAAGSDPKLAAIRNAAKIGCIAQLIAASTAGGSADLGLLFFALAAMAAHRSTSASAPMAVGTTLSRTERQEGA